MPEKNELKDEDLESVTGGGDSDLENRIIAIIKNKLDLNNISVTTETEIIGDLGADSLDVVDLIQALEAEFRISFDGANFSSSATVEDIVKYVLSKISTINL